VQFARRVFDANHVFNGIIVASLTTDYLNESFGSISLGPNSGIALFGEDGIIRGGAGIYATSIGKSTADVPNWNEPDDPANLKHGVVASPSGGEAIAVLPVIGYPMAIRVVVHDELMESKRTNRHWFYTTGSLCATLLILLAAAMAVLRRHSFDARIVRLAHVDNLTGAPNRLRFTKDLEAALLKTSKSSAFALHLIDLDGFKFVNDSYGHQLGDQILKVVTAKLQASLRSCDSFARLGGDEFAVIQNIEHIDHPSSDASALATRLCTILGEPLIIEGFSIMIGASIGIAMSEGVPGADDLMKRADLALYEAKNVGRGNFQFFDSTLEATYNERRELERDLKRAIEERQFVLHYQPIVDIVSGSLTGYEALVRWQHPTRGLVSPAVFIPAAEETGLIVPIGEWILQQACCDIATCDQNLTIAVNCSALQLKSVDFMAAVTSALALSAIDPKRLVLEITESVFISKDSTTLSHLSALRELGISLALDDFGTGYSSLNYVMSHPFSVLKIDRSFTNQLGTDTRALSVITAICSLAHSLNMKTVAEGVETVEQLETLKRLGCQAAQGFYLSKPRPADEILNKPYNAALVEGQTSFLVAAE
jgi:diguanylate cyclase (GGDEF)-like protein